MAAVLAESMVGGIRFHPDVIQSECSRVSVLNHTGSFTVPSARNRNRVSWQRLRSYRGAPFRRESDAKTEMGKAEPPVLPVIRTMVLEEVRNNW